MIINLEWNASALAAPQNFRDSIQQAANIIDAAFTDQVTINITVGYGDIAGSPVTYGAEGGYIGVGDPYSQYLATLRAVATSNFAVSAFASLPTTPSLAGTSYFNIAYAQAKMLGYGGFTANGTEIDGNTGFATNLSGDVLVSSALHELTHAMGRSPGTSLDWFRYSAPGQWQFNQNVPAPAAYLSFDGGVTQTAQFDRNSDPSDFAYTPASSNGADSFDYSSITNGTPVLTTVDLEVMQALGYHVSDPGGNSFYGAGHTIQLSALPNATAYIYGAALGWDTVVGSFGAVHIDNVRIGLYGGDDTIYFDAGPDEVVAFFNTNGMWNGVYGANGTIELNGSRAAVYGASSTVIFASGSGNVAALYNGGDAWDGVYGSNGEIELTNVKAAIYGGGDVIDFIGVNGNVAALYNSGGAWDGVTGGWGVVELSSVRAALYGPSDTIVFAGGSGNIAALYNSSGAWDGVYGSNGEVDLTNVRAAVYGSGDTILFAGGSGNIAALYNSSGAWDGVYGSNGEVDLTNVRAAVYGSGDTILFAGGSGNIAALYNSGGAWDGVFGSNGEVDVTNAKVAVYGSADTIRLAAGSGNVVALNGAGYSVYGTGCVIEIDNAQASIRGDNNTVYFNSAQNAAAISGAGETFAFQATLGLTSIAGYASSDTLVFSAADQGRLAFQQNGADTDITIDSANTVVLSNVLLASLGAVVYT